MPKEVAEGEGCPQCGTGKKDPEEIRQAIRASTLCLLTHPDRPGVIRIEQTYSTLEKCHEDNVWGDWQVHRYRNVEDSQLAESLIWELVGQPRPKDNEPIVVDLKVIEQAFRALVPRMHSAIAFAEKRKEGIGKRDCTEGESQRTFTVPTSVGRVLGTGRCFCDESNRAADLLGYSHF